MKYAYLVPEGQHDVAVIGKILELHGAVPIRTIAKLKEHGVYEFWKRFVNLKFPYEDKRPRKPGVQLEEIGDFTQPMPVPSFYQLPNYSIAIHCAGGDFQKIGTFITRNLSNWDDAVNLSAFAVFCDADEDVPATVYQSLKTVLQDIEQVSPVLSHFIHMTQPGEVIIDDVPTRVGVYVFPDNQGTGTLESMLIECAGISYSNLFGLASDYVATAQAEMNKNWNESKKLKATIGSIANVLRPGASNRVTIQHDNWICTETMELASVSRLNSFLTQLLELS